MWLLALGAVFAAEPTTGLHGASAFGPGSSGLGGGLSYGLNVGHLDLELAGDVAFGGSTAAWVRPQVRLHALDPRAMGPHLVAGGGVLFVPDADDAALSAGVGFDLMRTPWRPRVQALFVGWPGNEPRTFLTVGLVHRPAPPPPPTPVERPTFSSAMVWVPDPVCEWLPPDEASDAFPPDVPTEAVATVAVPAPPDRRSDDLLAQPLGDLVVAALPGDVVRVAEQIVPIDVDGIAWVSLPEGPQTVRVRGGGRAEVLDVALAAGATLWVTPSVPEPVELRFQVGSAQLEGPSATALDAFADSLGNWHVHIQGSFSEEGDPRANEALALRRAASARERLTVAGISGDRIRILPPGSPPDGVPPEEQRSALLTAVAPTEAP